VEEEEVKDWVREFQEAMISASKSNHKSRIVLNVFSFESILDVYLSVFPYSSVIRID
jgi:hypothetical protein